MTDTRDPEDSGAGSTDHPTPVQPAQWASPPVPEPYPFGANPYQRSSDTQRTVDGQQSPTQPYSQERPVPYGAVAGAEAGATPTDAAPKSRRRTGAIGIAVAALAVGALIGGVSGAGATAAILGNQQDDSPASVAGPANVTVNDGADATVITGVAASAGPSVVTISVSDTSSGSGGTGSGVILSDDGFVLTNTHVVTLDGAVAQPTVSVQTSDGRLFPAEIVGTDPVSDLAVIKVQGATDLQPAEFADSSKLNVGDTAVAIGAPLGLANTVTNGIVSSLNRSITVASSAAPDSSSDESDEGQDDNPFGFRFDTPGETPAPTQAQSSIALSVIQTDAAINPGNSGGALLDTDGRVIGINVAIASAGQGSTGSTAGSIGVGFAIPSNLAKRIATEIMDNGTGTHGLLGASVANVDASDSTVVGATIREVSAGGAAEVGGLQAGDIVTKVDDIPVTNQTDLTAQIRALAAGAKATITYLRDGRSDTAEVTLGSLS